MAIYTCRVVTVRFTFSEAENRRAMVYIALRSSATSAMFAMGAALLAGGLAAAQAVVTLVGAAELACWILLVVALPLLSARRMAATSSEHTMSFSDDGVDAASAAGSGRIDWRQWSGWRRSGGLYVLRGARRAFVFVPQRAFAGPGEEAEFRRLLARHVGPRAPSRGPSADPGH